MRWTCDGHPGRVVRLAYCLNLHAADDLEGTLEGLRRVTRPLAERLGADGAGGALGPFGIGAYLPGAVALALDEGGLARLGDELAEGDLDAFTFNAFPFGGFQRDGLKTDVYRPTWMEEPRVAYTKAVARAAEALFARTTPAGDRAGRHVSISTHPGAFGAWVRGAADREAIATGLARAVHELVRIEARGGPRIVLALEAEPRASANDTRALAAFFEAAHPLAARALRAEGVPPDEAEGALARHLGTCLDACHSAVEFEDPGEALALATRGGPLGKLQFSSALALADPGRDEAGRRALLAMDEPRFLHQVTGRGKAGLERADDLPELAHALLDDAGPRDDDGARARWLACDEWRCHFHVPVDREVVGERLATTRGHADRLLAQLLADPNAWSTDELHVEIETYTWDVLPGEARGPGALVDALEREYRHVMGLLAEAGWRRSAARADLGEGRP